MARMVNCVKLGREAEGLDFPPVPGRSWQASLGKRFEGSVGRLAETSNDAGQ